LKKFWRCHVCNDIHYGIFPPEVCSTCKVEFGYIEVSSEEARKVMSVTESTLSREDFVTAIHRFAKMREFNVNPDTERVDMLTGGVFTCESNHGLKYCPCRMIEKDFESDLSLICPCNFLLHETYKDLDDGECWCGLFTKKEIP
jgi:ferredoxin-thioredoxin reductase catalytic subunit